MGRFIDLSGVRFGRLIAIHRANNIGTHTAWMCKCDCGVNKIIVGMCLKRGTTSSCGCLKVDNMTTHGMTKTPEYIAWIQMKARCHDTRNRLYCEYGARGISVCSRWLESFNNFYLDVGLRPSLSHSIERLDNSSGYGPGNCVWADKQQQANNRRTNTLVTLDGISDTVANWARKIGIKASTICSRLDRGWSDKATLTKPLYYRGEVT